MDPNPVHIYFLLFFLLICSAVFSLAETAFTATPVSRIYKLRSDKRRSHRILALLLEKKEQLISTILIGNNVVNIFASSLVTFLMLIFSKSEFSLEIALLATTFVIIIFGEIIPKTIAINNSEKYAIFFAPLFFVICKLFVPILYFVNGFTKVILKPLGLDKNKYHLSFHDTIKGEIEFFHESGSVVKNDRDMLDGILDLDQIDVENIMTPRKNVVMININDTPDTIIHTVLRSGHTRIPAYNNSKDEVVGILHAKELISLLHSKKDITNSDLNSILFKPHFISANTKLKQQLFEFKKSRAHMAIIVDEYGGIIGVLTLEDIIEEIVGSIEDEHDTTADEDFYQGDDGVIIVKGDYHIRDFNKKTDLNFPSDEFSTIAGIIIEKAEKIPESGEIFLIGDYEFEVLRKDGAKIHLVKIKKQNKSNDK